MNIYTLEKFLEKINYEKEEKKKILILHGSSCVGKSFIMKKFPNFFNKIEIDECGIYKEKAKGLSKEMKDKICQDYLVIKLKNQNKRNIVTTCGNLPLPKNKFYDNIKNKFDVEIEHILILVRDENKYIENISERINYKNSLFFYKVKSLIKSYNWRFSTKELYDIILYND